MMRIRKPTTAGASFKASGNTLRPCHAALGAAGRWHPGAQRPGMVQEGQLCMIAHAARVVLNSGCELSTGRLGWCPRQLMSLSCRCTTPVSYRELAISSGLHERHASNGHGGRHVPLALVAALGAPGNQNHARCCRPKQHGRQRCIPDHMLLAVCSSSSSFLALTCKERKSSLAAGLQGWHECAWTVGMFSERNCTERHIDRPFNPLICGRCSVQRWGYKVTACRAYLQRSSRS